MNQDQVQQAIQPAPSMLCHIVGSAMQFISLPLSPSCVSAFHFMYSRSIIILFVYRRPASKVPHGGLSVWLGAGGRRNSSTVETERPARTGYSARKRRGTLPLLYDSSTWTSWTGLELVKQISFYFHVVAPCHPSAPSLCSLHISQALSFSFFPSPSLFLPILSVCDLCSRLCLALSDSL